MDKDSQCSGKAEIQISRLIWESWRKIASRSRQFTMSLDESDDTNLSAGLGLDTYISS